MAEVVAAPADMERIVCDWLRDQLGVTVATTLVDWRAGVEHVMVRRDGGEDLEYGWLDRASVVLEVRAADRAAAVDLAARTRAAMTAMRWHRPDDAVISRVSQSSGPAWEPDRDDEGIYRMTWQVATHPRKRR